MKLIEAAKNLEGFQTISTISKILKVSKRTAVNYAWRLRKAGYLTTAYGGKKTKIYKISRLLREKKGYNFYELFNNYSKIKLSPREDYIIHSEKEPSIEEILARGIDIMEFRVVLGVLGLFNKIKSWSKLKYFADKYDIGRKIGALYDVARTIIRVKRMDKRIRKGLLNGKGGYIINNVKTRDFKNIEKEWKVFIPFNKQDLMVYKE